MNKNQQKQLFSQIVGIYDLVNSILETLENEKTKSLKDDYLAIEPIVLEIQRSVPIIEECYAKYVKNHFDMRNKKDLESSIRSIFDKIDQFNKKITTIN